MFDRLDPGLTSAVPLQGRGDLPGLTLRLKELGAQPMTSPHQRLRSLIAIDDQAVPLNGDIRLSYFQHVLGGRVRGRGTWQVAWAFHQELFVQLADLVQPSPALTGGSWAPSQGLEALTRALRAGRNLVCWEAFRYGPFDSALWARLGRLYLEAQAHAWADTAVMLADGPSSPRREFMIAATLRCGALDNLPLELMDMADRLNCQLAEWLQLESREFQGARWQLDLANGVAPRRMFLGENPRSGLFLGPGDAGRALDEIEGDLRQGRLFHWGTQDDGEEMAKAKACLAHLRRLWLGPAPARRYRRHALAGQISLVHGWTSMLSSLAGSGENSTAVLELCDVSTGGLALRGSGELVGNLRIGDLVGIRDLGGGEWQLCAVRRLQQELGSTVMLGLEIIAKEPRLVEADDGQRSIQGILCDNMRQGAAVRFITPSQAMRSENAIFLRDEGSVHKLRPLGKAARGQLYEVREFQVL